LHTPKAIAEVFSFISRNKISNLNKESANNLLNFFFELNKIYNVWDFEVKTSEIPNDVKDLAEKRLEAKKDKKWEEADKLRNKIMELGWVVKDTKDSYELEKK
jgi:cysteinyl-tRNA synthetase